VICVRYAISLIRPANISLLLHMNEAKVWNLFRHWRRAGARHGSARCGSQSVPKAGQQRQTSPSSRRVRHQRAEQEHRQSLAAFKLARSQGRSIQCIRCLRMQLSRFYARKQLLFSVRLSHRNSVRLSVCHTGGSVKNGARQDHQIFTVGCLEDSSFRNRKAFP